MTEPQRAYESTGRRYIYDGQGRERVRVKRCPNDRAILDDRGGILFCPECEWAGDREQVAR
uniref:hypothetical protein n=1 Tax=Paractinoplanes polyasparticus TaxID=2856853 RepID=UPI001C85346D|nr:hypothetical protein [Actinoplanes polyasparticus]